jgi:ornithine cyclodeaminase/alanine dehydrogenase-like protein (mu-crystallin family)
VPLILSKDDVDSIVAEHRGALFDDILCRVREAYAMMAQGRVLQHPRVFLREPDTDQMYPPGLFSMSGLLLDGGYMGTRLQGLTDPLGGGDGVLVLFDYSDGRCLAVIDNASLHKYRSGAPPAIATELLARPDSHRVACIGSGPIAEGALVMANQVLPEITTVKVYSPTEANRTRFARDMSAELGLNVQAVEGPDEATRDADVIITATDAYRPVVSDAAIPDGAHISLLARNEIEMQTFERARVTRGSQAEDTIDPPWRYPIPTEWINHELADLVASGDRARQSDDELTVFFVGGSGPLAMWDIATAVAVYERARASDSGTDVAFAG